MNKAEWGGNFLETKDIFLLATREANALFPKKNVRRLPRAEIEQKTQKGFYAVLRGIRHSLNSKRDRK